MYIDSILNTLKLISLWPRLARALPQQFHATLALLTLKKLPKILLVQKRVKRLPKPSRFCPIGVCQLLHAFFPEASGWLPPHAPADTVRSVSPGFRSPGKRRTWRARARCSAPAGGRPCSDVAGPPVSRSRARSSPGQGRGGERDLGAPAARLVNRCGWPVPCIRRSAGKGCPDVWGSRGRVRFGWRRQRVLQPEIASSWARRFCTCQRRAGCRAPTPASLGRCSCVCDAGSCRVLRLPVYFHSEELLNEAGVGVINK